VVSLVGCSSHLGVEWGSAARLGGVVARIVVGPAKGQALLGGCGRLPESFSHLKSAIWGQ
jgi:hypothetical protein